MAEAEAAITASLSAEGLQFLEKYFTETDFPLTRHHIDSYEQCMFHEIPSIIHSSNPIVFLKQPLDADGDAFAYRVEIYIGGKADRPEDLALKIAPPVVTVDAGNTVRRMFPNEARLRNLTYAAQILADVSVHVTLSERDPTTGGIKSRELPPRTYADFPLFRMPILLRSRLCPTGVADPARLEEMGECRNDYGGYFIVRGAEKVLVTRGEQAFNSLYVEKKDDPKNNTQAYAAVVSLDPKTKQTRRVALYMNRERTDPVGNVTGGEIRVALPMIRGAFPLFIAFRALGIESDEEIVRLIFPDPNEPLAQELIPSIEDAYPFHNKYTATRYIMTLTKGFTEAHVLDILHNLMLPHVPDEPMARAYYLAEMTREMLLAKAGRRPKADRDDMRAQRFLPTGVLVRELFNGCYKEWRKATVLTIDRTYRSNDQLYEGERVFDLFEGNLGKLFEPETLNKMIMRGFGGRWGTDERNEKTGVIQPLARISYLDATSHQRRVVSDFDTGMKTTGPRKLHTSHIGYFCTSETPQGAHIGVTKNLSIMAQFSFGAPVAPVYAWLKAKGGLIPVAETTAPLRAAAATVQINGGTVGFTLTPRDLVQTLRLFKWTGCIAPTASISFNTTDRTVRIYLDEGRPVRPLWHLGGEGARFLERLPALKATRWRDLVFGTFPARRDASLRSVEFLDPLAENPAATAADYQALLSPVAGFIEYCDPNEMNEAYISWWGSEEDLSVEHTHAEIHPSTMTGLMASMIPFSNHNQAPRNQLSNSQSKQGIGTVATNIHNRYDTYSHQLCYGESPLCRTFYYENIGNGEMSYGFNCVIAATSESGYNQDDGLILNRDSIARGMFKSVAFRSYNCAEEVDPRTKVHSHVANPGSVPAWTALRPGLDYSKLDDRGIIREGEVVTDKTVLVGRYMVIPDTNEVKDASVTPGLFTKGRVDSVVVLHQGDGLMLVKVRVTEMRDPVLGDKFSSRHGQKGTIGMFVSAADLPRTAEGLVPDVMVNPGGFISRMTVAQLVEMIGGLLGANVVSKMNATTFCNSGDYVTKLGDSLEQLGVHRAGDQILYSGVTGKQLACEIFMCPLYFMRLKHLTEDKVNSRGAGRREQKTHQPTGGRANEGGLRIGEMEHDSLCAHAMSLFLKESMMERSDGTTFWICNGCGRIPIYNEAEGLFVCSNCDGPLEYTGVDAATMTMQLPTKQSRVSFSRVAMPYAMKLLDQEITTFGNMGFRIVAEGTVSRLKDATWPWPTETYKVEGAGGAVTAGEAVNPEARAAAEAEAEAAAAAAKPKRKKGGAAAAAAAPTGPEAGAEGAAEVLEAAVAAAKGDEVATAGTMAGSVRFYSKLQNEYIGFSNFATAPFAVDNEQIPAPDGRQYPPFRFTAGSSAAGGGPTTTWPTVEHYYQAMKFPDDAAWQSEIYRASTPAKAKKLGLSRDHPLRGDWDVIKERVMKKALLAKFQQNPGLLALLQQTGDKPLIEASPGDAYWGAGRNSKGKNRLGALLAEVRTELAGIRVDQEVLAGAPRVGVEEEASELESEGAEAEDLAGAALQTGDLAEAAANTVAAATGGMVQMAAGGEGGTGELQKGGAAPGVVMIINPQMGGAMEQARARRARSRSRTGAISWSGMTVSREEAVDAANGDGSYEGPPTQSGGSEQMTVDTGNTVEVTVEKVE